MGQGPSAGAQLLDLAVRKVLPVADAQTGLGRLTGGGWQEEGGKVRQGKFFMSAVGASVVHN